MASIGDWEEPLYHMGAPNYNVQSRRPRTVRIRDPDEDEDGIVNRRQKKYKKCELHGHNRRRCKGPNLGQGDPDGRATATWAVRCSRMRFGNAGSQGTANRGRGGSTAARKRSRSGSHATANMGSTSHVAANMGSTSHEAANMGNNSRGKGGRKGRGYFHGSESSVGLEFRGYDSGAASGNSGATSGQASYNMFGNTQVNIGSYFGGYAQSSSVLATSRWVISSAPAASQWPPSSAPVALQWLPLSAQRRIVLPSMATPSLPTTSSTVLGPSQPKKRFFRVNWYGPITLP